MRTGKTGRISYLDEADQTLARLRDHGDSIAFLTGRAPSAITPVALAHPAAAVTERPDALPYFDQEAPPVWIDREFGRKPPTSPSASDEVAFITGIGADGKLTDRSYWGTVDSTAFKWGSSTQGTGGTITYSFDAKAHFTAQEKATFLKAFAMWSSVADVTFVEASRNAGVVLTRGHDGGAYTQTPTSDGSGAKLGSVTGQAKISIDTSVPGFDLSGSLDKFGGYGMSTIIHEVGHLLGLGHGGAYNGDVTAKTDQFSAFDDRQYSIMSYINYTNTDAKYAASNPWGGTDWGTDRQGYDRTAPHSVMALDIVGIQEIYGASKHTPMSGGQTYGFHSNIAGPLHDFFDFTVNTSPVVTIFNEGTGNTFDLSGYSVGQYIDLRPGAFSSVGGLVNNVCVAFGTNIGTAIGGVGNDTLVANDAGGTLLAGGGNDVLFGGAGADGLVGDAGNDVLIGGLGRDVLVGGGDADLFVFGAGDSGKTAKLADEIGDFIHKQGDRIDLSGIDAIAATKADDAFTFIKGAAFGHHAGELRFELMQGDLYVSGDTNGDAKADFFLRLDDVKTIVAADFVL